jgi:Ca2+-binding EF-hand superfamily protein
MGMSSTAGFKEPSAFEATDPKQLRKMAGQISCVGWSDFGRTADERNWILKFIETKAGQKFKTVREAFRFVDSDQDGHVDQEEMRYFFRAYDIPPYVADRFFEFLDVEKKGELEYDYFINYFKPYVVRGVHGFFGISQAKRQSINFMGADDAAEVDVNQEIEEQLEPELRAQLRRLMQDIGRKLPLKFKAPRDAFRELDLERNGRITRKEMQGFFRGFGYNEEVADKVFTLLAEGETNDVSFSAFMAHFDLVVGSQFRQAKRTPLIPVGDHLHQAVVDKVAKSMQERMTTKYKNVQAAFRDLDLNKDGSVDRHEMAVFLKKLGHEKVADTFFDAMDEDKSGFITYDEFRALCGEDDRRNPSGAGQFRR